MDGDSRLADTEYFEFSKDLPNASDVHAPVNAQQCVFFAPMDADESQNSNGGGLTVSDLLQGLGRN